jgi:hypothetical protein
MKEFCPDYCHGIDDSRFCTAPTYLSDGDRSKDRCFRLDDEVLDKPIDIEVIFGRDKWRSTQIVGENNKEWILADMSRVQKGSPVIRR